MKNIGKAIVSIIVTASCFIFAVSAFSGHGNGDVGVSAHSEQYMHHKQEKYYQEKPEMAVIPTANVENKGSDSDDNASLADEKSMAVIPSSE